MATNFDGVNVVKAPKEAISRCPKCDKRLETIWSKIRKDFGEKKEILLCPHCEVFLGYGLKIH
jgi:uncharacterized protein with PIN domain